MLSYDGTGYHGWQVQARERTIQGAVLDVARRIVGDGVRLIGASRTDAGVHALGQVASLTADTGLDAAALGRALNALLPREIRVLGAADAPAGFDARRAATGKRYAYLIDRGPVASPLLARYAWHVPGRLDEAAMREGLAALRGRHDFSAFCAAAGREHEPTCHVRSIRLVGRRDRLAVLVSADRFLHHMVRNVVGSAVQVGRGARPARWIREVLASGDRRRAGPTAPARGLALVRVLYVGDPFGGTGRVESAIGGTNEE